MMSVVTVISTLPERNMSARQGSVSATRTSMCRLEEVAHTSERLSWACWREISMAYRQGMSFCAARAVNAASDDVKVV